MKKQITGTITTLIDAVRIDNDPTTSSSSKLDVHDFSKGLLFIDIDSTLAPTDLLIDLEVSDDNGTTWYKLMNDFLSDLRYEDTATASGLKECLEIPLPGDDIRVTVTGTGTDATNYFDVTIKLQPLNG